MSPDHAETQTTDTAWPSLPAEESACPHLVVVWSEGEPERSGEVAAIGGPCLFGRGADSSALDPPKLELVRQRPLANEPAGLPTNPKLSRRQWLLEPRDGGVWVRGVGRRSLIHNGVPATECLARSGDTLAAQGALVAVVELRPRVLPHLEQAPFPFGAADENGIVGESAAVWDLRREIAFIARSKGHCLVLGESGSGKELVAHALHRLSQGKGTLVSRNAATIPESLVEAELFGNVAGYPNAGTPERKGLIGAANGGTLFLDEIGELGEAQQANLLRVLDAGEYQRLGEDRSRTSHFRLIAATNRAPEHLKHDFLARFPEQIFCPGLPERRGDVTLLIRQILAALGEGETRVQLELVERLVRHRYTLHYRELERLVRLARRHSRPGSLELGPEVSAELAPDRSPTAPEASAVRAALALGGSASDTARKLGLPSRFALYRLMKKLGIPPA